VVNPKWLVSVSFLGYLGCLFIQGLAATLAWNVSVLARVFGPLGYFEALATFLIIRILFKNWPFDRLYRAIRIYDSIEE